MNKTQYHKPSIFFLNGKWNCEDAHYLGSGDSTREAYFAWVRAIAWSYDCSHYSNNVNYIFSYDKTQKKTCGVKV